MSTPLPGQKVRGSHSGAPVMALLDLLGRSWAMGVVWILAKQGPCGFSELQRRCESISPSVLSTRLKDLQTTRLITQIDGEYTLTQHGRELFGLIEPLGSWACDWAQDLTDTRHADRPPRR